MAADLGRRLAQFACGTARRSRPAILLLRMEGVAALVVRLGVDAADDLCRTLRDRLLRDLRSGEYLAAQQGTDLQVILPPAPERELMHRAAALRRTCAAPLPCGGRPVSVRVTAVLAQDKGRLRAPESALGTAATAYLDGLHQTRLGALWTIDIGTGAGPIVLPQATPQPRRAAVTTRATPPLAAQRGEQTSNSADHLADVLRNRALEMWCLPIYCCDSGRPSGFELRPRWRHPRLGLSGTAPFLEALDPDSRYLLIGQLLAGAADALAALQSAGCSRASMMLSITGFELAESNFAEHLLWEADRADVHPARFELSFDEDALPPAAPDAASAARIAGNLDRLRAAGVALTVARFGTGVLAPNEVRRHGVRGVMLDRSFLRGVGPGALPPMLVSLLALARREGLAVTADGVASADVLALLSRLGCARARGPGLGQTLPLHGCPAEMARAIATWDAPPPLLRARRR